MIKEILEELIRKTSDGDIGYAVQIAGKKEIPIALAQIKKEMMEMLPKEEDICYSKINMGFADSREYRQEGWNECRTETKARVEEVFK